MAVVARLDELLPRRRLIHAEAREVGRRAVVEPGRGDRVRGAAGRVLEDDRPVPRVLQLDRCVGLPLDRDGVPDHGHLLPSAEMPVLVRIGRVGLVDVEVLVVLPEDGQAPRAVLVVADGHAGQDRLPAADDVPAGGHQVHPVSERRRRLRAVRVVRHDRIAAERPRAVHHPVVAADRVVVVPFQVDLGRHRGRKPLEGRAVAPEGKGDVVRLEGDRPAVGAIPVEDVAGQARGVDGGIDPQVGVADVVIQLLDGLGAERRDRPCGADLLRHVRHQALVARDDHLGHPVSRRDAEQLELDRQQVRLARRPVDVGVDAIDERRDDLVAPRVVVAHLGREVAPKAEQARAGVALDLSRAENLGDRPGGAPPPDLELEEPVARRGVALREEQVVLVLRVDVGDAPPVGDDFHRCDQTRRVERFRPGILRHGARSARGQERRHDGRRPDAAPPRHGRTPLFGGIRPL